MRNTIILNGIESNTIPGLLIQSLPQISKPLMRTEIEEIDGRDGDIVTNLGFSAYDKQFTIGLYGTFDINQVIAYFNSEGTVTFSNEPDKYYNYQIKDQIDFERLVRYRTATVTMHCQPFKYSTTEGSETLQPTTTNLLSLPNFNKTTNGITLTVTDGVISVSGTPSVATEFYVPTGGLNLTAGTFTLSAQAIGTRVTAGSIRLIGSAPSDADSLGGNYMGLKNGETVSISGTLSAAKTFNYLWFYITTGGAINFTMTAKVENNAEKVASGEGTTLALLNTPVSPFSKYDLKGNTYQQTYSGKNLFDNTMEVSAAASRTTSSAIPTGVRVAQTTASASGSYYWVLYIIGKTADYVGKTLTISASNAIASSTNAPRIGIGLCNADGGSATGFSLNDTFPGSASKTFTQSDSDNRPNICLVLYATAGAAAEANSYVDYTNLQVEVGSTATSYEPYVGGIPSPNPDYPQEILTVKHQNMVRLTGKNLVSANELYLYPGAERTSDGLRKTITSSNITTYFAPSIANPIGVYTVSFEARISNADQATLVLNSSASIWGYSNLTLNDKDGNAADANYRSLGGSWKRYSFTVIASSSNPWGTAQAMSLSFTSYTNSPVFELKNFQIEVGTAATEFDNSAPQMYPVDFRTGKNLLSTDFLTMGGLNNGEIDISIGHQVNNVFAPTKVSPNTAYTISVNLGETVKGMRVKVDECDENAVFLQTNGWHQLASGAYTFTTRADSGYIKMAFSLSTTSATVTAGDTESTIVFNTPTEWLRGAALQVEQGSTATSYEDYESIELCKIGDYQDYIYKSGDDWYVHKETGKVVLDGSDDENWQAGVGGNLRCFSSKQYSDMISDSSRHIILSDYFYYISQGHNFGGGFIYQKRFYLYYGDTNTTANDFKAWLASNNTTVYYALATPTDIQITNLTAIVTLESLKSSSHAYKGVTFIQSLPPNSYVLPLVSSVEVTKSSDGLITNEGNIYSKPKLTIYGGGDIGVYVNGVQIFQITLGDEGYITIDTAAMEAYKDTTENLKNRLVTGDYDNFKLNPGTNQISFSGQVTSCVVSNYSRWL